MVHCVQVLSVLFMGFSMNCLHCRLFSFSELLLPILALEWALFFKVGLGFGKCLVCLCQENVVPLLLSPIGPFCFKRECL